MRFNNKFIKHIILSSCVLFSLQMPTWAESSYQQYLQNADPAYIELFDELHQEKQIDLSLLAKSNYFQSQIRSFNAELIQVLPIHLRSKMTELELYRLFLSS